MGLFMQLCREIGLRAVQRRLDVPNYIMVEVISQSGACIFFQVARGMKKISLRVFSALRRLD